MADQRKRRVKIKTRKPIAPPTKVFKDRKKEPFRKRKHKKTGTDILNQGPETDSSDLIPTAKSSSALKLPVAGARETKSNNLRSNK